ncbi:hypothetical protein [Reyranella sp. CPCC 100927]|uniref:hypothetical protein n=1 Tax=Reyranella sp. CPCC 100927 TaxID=2599616 RepID=UPI0011B559DD|nr:hypothetical protein [Reyranella sp. CPCC 100927]TWT11572.1 hypothetical protein FQU96_13930 [Reyranella sp. CPCC 100927]
MIRSASALPLLMAWGVSGPDAVAQSGPPAERLPSFEAALKADIRTFAAADLSNVQFLQDKLSTRLEEGPSSNPRLTIRHGKGGRFARQEIGDVELRTEKDSGAQSILIINFVQPRVQASTFVASWPDATLTPASPHASGSTPYWGFKEGGRPVFIGMPRDKDLISSVSFHRKP